MTKSIFIFSFLAVFWNTALAASDAGMNKHPDVQAFIREMEKSHSMSVESLDAIFSRVSPNRRVLELIAPPKTPAQRSWRRYQSRFVDEAHIRQGLEFWEKNAATLEQASAQYGIPEEIIVAIIGVETLYGRNTGNFGILEALSTLAFYYPPRSAFFRQELEQFLLLAFENDISPLSCYGSYAGAIGIPQFMPGSQRRYAVDFDKDGKIDLKNSVADAIGSIANFLSLHGWEPGMPIAVPATLDKEPNPLWIKAGIFPSLPVETLLAEGVLSDARQEATVAFIDLVSPEEATEYWLGYHNFYVITRYNRSSFYAMAVFQLSDALKKRYLADADHALRFFQKQK